MCMENSIYCKLVFSWQKIWSLNVSQTSHQIGVLKFLWSSVNEYKSLPSQIRIYPHTSSAISFTSLSFAHCCSSVSLFPISHDANPHCGLKYRRSSGTYFAASWILAITFSLSSSSGVFVVTSPKTTFLSPLTFASGANPPDLLSSYSR